MSQKPIVLRQRDILMAMEHAKNYLIQLPTHARLNGAISNLSAGERLALSYIHGVLMMAGGLGVSTEHVKISLDDSEHDPT